MVSVIIPVYNERTAVAATVKAIHNELTGHTPFEIIIVNDGSSDGSREEILKIKMDNVRSIHHPENLGYGKSLYDGIISSNYDCIVIIDADGSYPITDIKRLLEYYPQYDMVVGARTGKEYEAGLFKRPARFFFNFLSEYATGRKIDDINSGLRVFRKDLILKFKDTLCTGFSFTTTITLVFMLNHYFVKYIPIEYLSRDGKSKVRHFRDTLRALQIIIQSILYFNPIKLFLLIAVLNSALGVVIGIANLWIHLPALSIVSGICIASFIPIFTVGLIADLVKRITRGMEGKNP